MTCDFQQCGILTSVDSVRPVQSPFGLRSSKWCSVRSLTVKEYLSDKQRLWSDCAYAQADLRLCWSHMPHCWKSHALTQMCIWPLSCWTLLPQCVSNEPLRRWQKWTLIMSSALVVYSAHIWCHFDYFKWRGKQCGPELGCYYMNTLIGSTLSDQRLQEHLDRSNRGRPHLMWLSWCLGVCKQNKKFQSYLQLTLFKV